MAKEKLRKDMIIIGGGVAGLTAALYAARMNMSVLILESALVGGQIVNAYNIENYPGFAAIKGSELVERIRAQAQGFGAVLDEFDAIVRVGLDKQPKLIETESYIYEAGTVIAASGMMRRKLPLPEAADYEGRGIHYCELCDGHLYKGKEIAVVGGGNAAVDAAVFLTKYASRVHLIHHGTVLTAEKIVQERLLSSGRAQVYLQTDIEGLMGTEHLDGLKLHEQKTGQVSLLPVAALFVNIGVVPNTVLFQDGLKLAPDGRILAGEDCRTSQAGVFAAGDVRVKPVRQLTTAAADGTVAAILAEKYLQKMKEEGKW